MTKDKNLTPEDKSLWDAYKQKVDRLKKEGVDDSVPSPMPSPSQTQKTEKIVQSPINPPKPRTPEPILKSTLSRQQLRKIQVEAELDLHGMTQHEAHQALHNFISHCYKGGKKTVLVITGKGFRKQIETSGREGGILRQKVPQWLNIDPLRSMIVSYTESAIKDGGSGALYVFLRKKR